MKAKAALLPLLTLSLALPAAAQPGGDPPADGDAASPAPGDGKDGEPSAQPPPKSEGIDVDALRQQYLQLRDRLFRSRARAATVASAVFSTKLQVNLYYTTGRFHTITRASIRLDGSSIFEDTEGSIAKNKTTRFEGWVAPGRHQIEIRIEAVGKDDERFKSVLQSSFTLQAPGGKDVIVTAAARDSGNVSYKWKRKQSGTYKLRLDVDIQTKKRAAAKTSALRSPHTKARKHVARHQTHQNAAGRSR